MLLVTMQLSLRLWTTSPLWGTLEALSLVEQSLALLQNPANYLVYTDKQYVYTMNEEHMSACSRITQSST